jgi:hypothetical protein
MTTSSSAAALEDLALRLSHSAACAVASLSLTVLLWQVCEQVTYESRVRLRRGLLFFQALFLHCRSITICVIAWQRHSTKDPLSILYLSADNGTDLYFVRLSGSFAIELGLDFGLRASRTRFVRVCTLSA